WDKAQTHESLRRHLLEETYEVLEAIDELEDSTEGFEALCEELGDLLFQVFIHAELAREAGHFTIVDVATGIYDKLYHRHPHVFGNEPDGAEATTPTVTAAEAVASWEQAKKAEKQRDSVMDGIPHNLPALLFASKIQAKAAATGRPLPSVVAAAIDDESSETDVGEAVFALVDKARSLGIDTEQALRVVAQRAEASFRLGENE
ncbi:MAG: MazG nucleotide pyrophosphohydrolase domain-containing protein, partial [Acidimicrobiales bacterium]